MKKFSLAILFLIVILGTSLRSYKLGEEAFARDEFFDVNTSYGRFKTGEWLAWDFNMDRPLEDALQKDYSNTRAQLFRLPLVFAYNFMEPTERNNRLLSVAWGIASIIIIYFITLSFTGNIYIALIAAFLTAIGESEVIFGRRLRMYSMLFPVYLAFSWCVYKFYESVYKGKFFIFQKIYEIFNVNPNFAIPAAILGYISYETQELTVHIGFTLVAYCVLMSIAKAWKKSFINKYTLTLLAALAGFVVLKTFLGGLYKEFNGAVTFFQNNYRCPEFFFTDFRYMLIGGILLILGGIFLAFKLEKKKESLFIFLSAAVPLFYATFGWTREPAGRYIYFIQSFGIILSAAGIYAIYYLLNNKFKNHKKILAVIVFVLTLFSLDYSYIKGADSIYQQRSTSNFIDFRKVFSTVKDNMKPEDVMITRAYRSFYFKDWKIKVFDIKALPFEKGDCQETVRKIIKENKNGIVVLPTIDHLSFCRNGRAYLEDNLKKIKTPEGVEGVNIYRWNN